MLKNIFTIRKSSFIKSFNQIRCFAYLPLHKNHQKLGAKFISFGGYQMPIKYQSTTLIEEYQAVRKEAGLFDVSHMGEILIQGKGASAFIQYLLANNTSKLVVGQAQYSPMLNERGGIIDDVLIYKLASDQFMLVINASNIEKDIKHMKSLLEYSNLPFSDTPPQITDISNQICLLALQGPKAFEIVNEALLSGKEKIDFKRGELKYYHFLTYNNLKKIGFIHPPIIISRTGYTGEEGVEVYSDSSLVSQIWETLLQVGKSLGLKPAGLGSRDILRLEAGFCLYGNELTEEIYPNEAGIGWAVKMKAGNFHGREALQKVKKEGFSRKLVPFVMNNSQTIPRTGYQILANNDNESIGYVTSGSKSPILNHGIGLGLIKNDSNITKFGSLIQIKIRNKTYQATIVKTPIHKQSIPIKK